MATSNPFEWQLFDGQKWSTICNDIFIESHYCQPGATGITINTSMGSLYIDFDAMTVSGPRANLSIRRNMFLSHNQKQEVGWYYKDNHRWCEYGSQGLSGNTSSITSDSIEQQYIQNPNGSVQFSAGHMNYTVDFTAMTQTNMYTLMMRKVRRRPKFNSTVTVNSSLPAPRMASPLHLPNTSTECIWEFMGDEGIWTEFQKPGCSLDSADIERLYQQNPQSQVSFIAGRQNYTLYLNGMYQINNRYGTKRVVRRIAGNQQINGQYSQVRWQFKDMDGFWKNYNKGGYRGYCSVSSEDIEAQYKQNPAGTMNFRAGRFNYDLNFSDMTQTNLSTYTVRDVRRL